jgi:hypothetical protein
MGERDPSSTADRKKSTQNSLIVWTAARAGRQTMRNKEAAPELTIDIDGGGCRSFSVGKPGIRPDGRSGGKVIRFDRSAVQRHDRQRRNSNLDGSISHGFGCRE